MIAPVIWITPDEIGASLTQSISEEIRRLWKKLGNSHKYEIKKGSVQKNTTVIGFRR